MALLNSSHDAVIGRGEWRSCSLLGKDGSCAGYVYWITQSAHCAKGIRHVFRRQFVAAVPVQAQSVLIGAVTPLFKSRRIPKSTNQPHRGIAEIRQNLEWAASRGRGQHEG